MIEMDVAGRTGFAELVRPNLRAMSLLAARFAPDADRDDVVQESLAAAWRKFGQFDPDRGSLQSWLLAIVADQARKARRRRRFAVVLDSDEPVHLDHPLDLDVERAVRALPERQRLAVALFYFVDLPVAEVALVMSCAEGTVKATLSQARAHLRTVLGEEFR